jgi:two-component system alkaline phosphatase synthesis response regulator PhoP
MPKTILVVDDQENLRKMLKDYLTEEGFSVLTAENGQAALYVARQGAPDMILLDIMMPEMDGYEFMRTYRRERQTPIILLTAKLEETDKVVGLELGADDYVTKPFGLRELVARIHAVLRRSERDSGELDLLRCGALAVDREKHHVEVDGELVNLTPSEFDLLVTLMSAPGRVFSRMDLLQRIQGSAFEGVERTIDVHVRNLRAKIEPDPANPSYIQTVFGVGYRFRPN